MSAPRKSLAAAMALCVLLGLLLSGCANYRETEDLIFIDAIAVDRAPNGKFLVTAETTNASGGMEAEIIPRYLECEGDTIVDAMRNMQKFSINELYWSHTEVLIMSQQVATEDLAEVIDTMMRVRQIRQSLALIVSKEPTAKEVLESENPTKQPNGPNIMNALRAQRLLGKAPYTQMFELVDTVAGQGEESVVALIGLSEVNGKKEIEVSGAAVIHSHWLVGFIDENDTRIFLLAAGRVKKTEFPLPADPGGKFSDSTVSLDTDRVSVTVGFENGKPWCEFGIVGNVILESIDGASPDPDQFQQVTDAILINTSMALENSLVALIQKTKGIGSSDILGIGSHLQDSQPELWKQINGQWNELYNQLDVRVWTDLKLRSTNQIAQPVAERE